MNKTEEKQEEKLIITEAEEPKTEEAEEVREETVRLGKYR